MGMAFAITSALTQSYAQNKALEAQGEANVQTARNYVTSMNYSFQNLEQERRDAFEGTISDLEKTKLQGNRQEASVAAAVNEGMVGGGRTANLLKRSASADTNRATASIKENYNKKSNEIDLNKESTLLNTKMQIKSIREVEAPSLLSTLMNLGTNYLQAKGTMESVKAIRDNAGVNDNKDTSSSLYLYNNSNNYSSDPTYSTIFGEYNYNAPMFHFDYQTNPLTRQKL